MMVSSISVYIKGTSQQKVENSEQLIAIHEMISYDTIL